ncbi:DUF397 domain-containing protein [Streptosporangium sp. NPDC004379]|uniref:DUF397 domain-containing protein n=1 Tax=Streptosporangium sp. NPDC004379 TaxID=3366189 RepID=UPI00369532A7
MNVSRITWRKSSLSGNGSNCVEVGVWRKSSLSAAQDCVEVSAWRRSSLSGSGQNCVEVAAGSQPDRLFLVRDSKDPEGPVLSFAPAEWDAFLVTVKSGALDALA